MSNIQGKLPVILSVSFVAVIIILSVIKFSNWDGPPLLLGVLFIVLYLLWLFAESRIAVGEIDMEKTRLDKGTLEAYAAARAATVITALASPSLSIANHLWLYIGITVFAGAVLLRLEAIRILGKFYSHRIRLQDEHKIIDHGPYHYIRHPAYTGMILAHTGFVIFFFSVPALIALMVLYMFVIVRILVEESMLLKLDAYKVYSKNKKRLIPCIW
ncbi:MAG: isoprenylcysteine carboxylmethyltransferase family protein [Desulfobacteraceae bacterium]|nr:isoprenylcysteine carboxylmethyltransferase family protein [Desulfobacteraceae bacterium]